MTLREARLLLQAILSKGGVDFPEREADILLSAGTKRTSAEIFSRPDALLPPSAADGLFDLARKRAEGKPLQYLLGEWEFYGRTLGVAENILIPRPETETVVDKALEVFSEGNFLDWGTGTGCIALSLLLHRPTARGIAADINPAALSTAWKNLGRYGCLGRTLLWHSRTPEDIPCPVGSLDLLVSNPPYIPASALPSLQREVMHEPRTALDGGPDGLACYRMLLAWCPERMKMGGRVLFEVGDGDQAERLREIAPTSLKCSGIFLDLQNKPRSILWIRV
ncbi:peptide chain release factor N(5)-glutamine methyltransferase [Aminivibrio sp.]